MSGKSVATAVLYTTLRQKATKKTAPFYQYEFHSKSR